jgi:hypothetical protein
MVILPSVIQMMVVMLHSVISMNAIAHQIVTPLFATQVTAIIHPLVIPPSVIQMTAVIY